MSREAVALTAPGDRSLAGFPRWRLTTTRQLARVHSVSHGVWWFGSSGASRFDLPAPEGTCYLAFDDTTAIREVAGPRLTASGVLSRAFVDQRVMSRVHVPQRQQLADACHVTAAAYGVTRELAVMTPFAVPQQWAAALRSRGVDGLRYQSRFTTGSRATTAALFGSAGARSWPGDDDPTPLSCAATTAGFTIVNPPRSVRVIAPPR